MAASGLSLTGAFIRGVMGLGLVLATYNPTGYSVAHWIVEPPLAVTPGKALAALAMLIAWLVCLRTTFVALGKLGLLLGVALLSALVWLLVDRHLVSLTGTGVIWVGLVVVGVLLGIGLSWSLLRAEVTGQVEVD